MITKEMIKKVIEKVSEENKKECINIKTHVDENLTIFDSKFGGIPYLPIHLLIMSNLLYLHK